MNRITDYFAKLPKKWVMPPLVVTAILVSFLAATMPDNNLHVSFLDAGQGDAILIQKGNQQVLVDGGPSPQAVCLGLGRKMPFWDRTIELMILTHPSSDHVTGLVEVLNRYRVREVLYPNLVFESGVYDEWLRLAKEKEIKSTLAQAGQQISLGDGVIIEVLNPSSPPLTGTDSDVDNNAALLRLSLGEVSFLLTTDMMWEAEFELLYDRANLKSTVLKVAHHGSDTSTTPEFLAVANPEQAVISVGADNDYGHPSPEVLRRLEERLGSENIYRTDKDGTIEFITDGEKLWVRTER
jgi:competence protein ComEC